MELLKVLALLLILAPIARAQNIPHAVDDPRIQEDLEYLYNQAKQNKSSLAVINSVTTSTSCANGLATITVANGQVTAATCQSAVSSSPLVHHSSVTITGDQSVGSGVTAFITGSSTTMTGQAVGNIIQCRASLNVELGAGAYALFWYTVDSVSKGTGTLGANEQDEGNALGGSGGTVHPALSFKATSTSHIFALVEKSVLGTSTIASTSGHNGGVECTEIRTFQ